MPGKPEYRKKLRGRYELEKPRRMLVRKGGGAAADWIAWGFRSSTHFGSFLLSLLG